MKLGYLSTLKTVGTLSTKIAIVAAASIGGASLVSSSVFAALTASATNTSATAVSSGYMSLTQAPGGASGGFSTAITAMAPLDSVVRLVTLTNASTLDAASMTLAVSDSTPTALTTNGTTGLQVTIQQCTVAYTAVTYACSGTESTVRAASSILSLATPQALTLIPASLLAGGVTYLKVAISLPDSTENTLNGVIPAGIQNKSASLTWTIAATQRTAATTNS
jgi:hypothetical protein